MSKLAAKVQLHKDGAEVEAITHPGYTVATKKRKRKELRDELDKTLAIGRFAIIDIPNDDPAYRLRFGLGKITAIQGEYVYFNWYMYGGYPEDLAPDYDQRWQLQILAGKGQKVDTGWCESRSIVMTFEKLTRSKTIPNLGRTAPLKIIRRALAGDFGPLPQASSRSGSDSSYQDSSNDDEDERECIANRPLTRYSKKYRAK